MVLSRKRLALLKRLEETEEDDKASSVRWVFVIFLFIPWWFRVPSILHQPSPILIQENASLVQAMARKSKGPSEVTFTLEQVSLVS